MPQMNIDTSSWTLFSFFKPLAALYFLVIAVTGKGKLLENEHTKCPREKYRFWMRILCVAAGVVLGATGVVELFELVDRNSFWGWVLWGAGLAAIVGVCAYNIAMTDREAARKAEEAKAAKSGTSRPGSSARMPDAAFSFGEETKDEQHRDAE